MNSILSMAMVAGLIGVVLGSRFQLLILVPGIGVISFLTAIFCIANGLGILSTAAAIAANITSLQLGYLLGAVAQYAPGLREPLNSQERIGRDAFR